MQTKQYHDWNFGCVRVVVSFFCMCICFCAFGYDLGDFESRSSLGSALATSSDEVALSLSPVVTSKSNVYSGRSQHFEQSSFSITTELNKGGGAPLYSMVSIASPSGIEGLMDKAGDFELKQSSLMLLGKVDIGDNFYSLNFGFFSKAKFLHDSVKVKSSMEVEPEQIDYLSTISDTGLVINLPLVIVPNRFILATQVWGWNRTGIANVAESNGQDDINKLFNRGIMWGVDLGFSLSIHDFWLPTLSVTVENLSTDCYENWLGKYPGKKICGATMQDKSIRDPDSELVVDSTNLKVGVGITPRLSKRVALSIHTVMDNIHVSMGDNYYYNPKEKALLSTGVELLFGNPFKDTPFKLGTAVNENSFSVSASFESEIFSLRVAYISEERYRYVPYNLYHTSSDVETESDLVSKYMVSIKFRTF